MSNNCLATTFLIFFLLKKIVKTIVCHHKWRNLKLGVKEANRKIFIGYPEGRNAERALGNGCGCCG